MTKFSIAVLGFAAALLLAGSANATPITYNLILTATAGSPTKIDGTGSFSIDGDDFTGSGTETFLFTSVSKTLLSLVFNIDGHTFDQSDAPPGSGTVKFTDGVVTFLNLSATEPGTFTLSVGSLSYSYSKPGNSTSGHIGATLVTTTNDPTDPIDPVPEPASLMLLGTGLAGIVLRRRRRV